MQTLWCRVTNTIQDLESDQVPRICLALDNLIMTPNEDVIPAVQSRLHVLLSHEQSVTIGTLPYIVSEAEPYFLYVAHMLGVEDCWPFGLYQTTTQNY
jgi:hypothetical protein